MQMQMRKFSHRTTILAGSRLRDPPKSRLKSGPVEEKTAQKGTAGGAPFFCFLTYTNEPGAPSLPSTCGKGGRPQNPTTGPRVPPIRSASAGSATIGGSMGLQAHECRPENKVAGCPILAAHLAARVGDHKTQPPALGPSHSLGVCGIGHSRREHGPSGP
jgi:hypothetical protein